MSSTEREERPTTVEEELASETEEPEAAGIVKLSGKSVSDSRGGCAERPCPKGRRHIP